MILHLRVVGKQVTCIMVQSGLHALSVLGKGNSVGHVHFQIVSVF